MPHDWKTEQPERFKRVVRAVCGISDCPWPGCKCVGSAADAERAINAWEELPPGYSAA